MADLPSTVPKHIAIIMDGNGRWAKEKGLARTDGHRAGADRVRQITEACHELGVEYLTLYAFSSENWKRPQPEVDALMLLLERFLQEQTDEILNNNIRFQAIGRLDQLPKRCQESLHRTIKQSASNTGLTLILALSYGGREEIIDGIKSVVNQVQSGNLNVESIDPDLFSKHLYTKFYPDPDLMIRTSGEMRLSNFLLWQLSYAEIVVTKKYWPDFGREELEEAIEEYARRQRRFGGL